MAHDYSIYKLPDNMPLPDETKKALQETIYQAARSARLIAFSEVKVATSSLSFTLAKGWWRNKMALATLKIVEKICNEKMAEARAVNFRTK